MLGWVHVAEFIATSTIVFRTIALAAKASCRFRRRTPTRVLSAAASLGARVFRTAPPPAPYGSMMLRAGVRTKTRQCWRQFSGSSDFDAPYRYDPHEAEPRWQRFWHENDTFRAPRLPRADAKGKKYVLDMFPYPSAAGLHVGHPLGYTASDAMARYWRHMGYDVLHPMGWDAFGLPAEQHAIATGEHPASSTARNINSFRRQLQSLGFSYDWDREVATTDTEYVRWTQWIFARLVERGLAVQRRSTVNWCAALGTVLANEEVMALPPGHTGRATDDGGRVAPVVGVSERGGHDVTRVELRQWQLRITEYASRLDEELKLLLPDNSDDDVNARLASACWPKGTVAAQHEWIGRMDGVFVEYDVRDALNSVIGRIKCFTTRADTIFGVSAVALSPAHPLVNLLLDAESKNADQHKFSEFVHRARARAEEKQSASTAGGETEHCFAGAGVHAVHPLTGEAVPLLVAEFVLADVGTGAVMVVPAHSDADLELAHAASLAAPVVIAPTDDDDEAVGDSTATMRLPPEAATQRGVVCNSPAAFMELDGQNSDDAIDTVATLLKERGAGGHGTTWHLRDWVFSRQRYWGEPIPICFPVNAAPEFDAATGCEFDPRCGHPHVVRYEEPKVLPDDELPLELPDLPPASLAPEPVSFEGEGVDAAGRLAGNDRAALEWRFFQRDGKWYARETNTMPQWAGSSWYFLRFLDPHNTEAPWGAEEEAAWMPVDLYVGGAEHATLHLLYARFWHKVFFDMGLVSDPEPFKRLVHQGMLLGPDGEKMSKSRGNVVNPDEVVAEHGADALRLYLMFMGPIEAMKPWQSSQIMGVVRFMTKVSTVCDRCVTRAHEGASSQHEAQSEVAEKLREAEGLLNSTIQKVRRDHDSLSFNTALSSMMVLTNALLKLEDAFASCTAGRAFEERAVRALVLMLSPMAPHLAEEMWRKIGNTETLAYEPWPEVEEGAVAAASGGTASIVVQINGKKVKNVMLELHDGTDDAGAREAALSIPAVSKRVQDSTVKKFIYVPGRIVNIVI